MMQQEKRGLSGSTLKLIAIVTMLIDHVGLGVVGRLMLLKPQLYDVYSIMRGIGRIAFPIFIFLLVEGMRKTSNVKKYALRLGAFALLSEIPFDLAFHMEILEFTYQNVFFTLFIGLLTIWAMDSAARLIEGKWLKVLLMAGILAAGAGLAELLRTDYGAKGILCIAVMYIFSFDRRLQLVAESISLLWERVAPLAFIPLAFYNGRRGLKLKYVFYVFYPLHLLLIYLLCLGLGLTYSII